MATASHFEQKICQPGAVALGLSTLALAPQNGQVFKSVMVILCKFLDGGLDGLSGGWKSSIWIFV